MLEGRKEAEEDKPIPKKSRGRPKKYETDEERKMYKKISSVNSANKTKLKKRLEPYNIKVGKVHFEKVEQIGGVVGERSSLKDGLSIDEAVSYIIQRPEHFNTGIVNLAKRIEVYLKPKKVVSTGTPRNDIGYGLPDFQDLNWGSLTKQLKAFKLSHPSINTLVKFAKYIIGNKDEFQEKTIKRATFYLNVILKGKGLDDGESSSDEGESSSDEGDNKKSKKELDDYLLGFGLGENKIISTNYIMPKFAKGSPEMKEHMAKLRAMKGKVHFENQGTLSPEPRVCGCPAVEQIGGVVGERSSLKKGSKSKTHSRVKFAEEGGAVLLPTGHLANKLDLSSYIPRNFNTGLERMGRLASTTMMNVPMSRTPRVINAGGIKPPPMRNSSLQRYEGVESGSKLGTAGNMTLQSLMSL